MSAAPVDRVWRVLNAIVLSSDDARADLYARGGRILSRTELHVDTADRASLATYFGAFPMAYWRRHTVVSALAFSCRSEGGARIQVRRVDDAGDIATVAVATVRGEAVVPLPADALADAAWIWAEIEPEGESATLSDMAWVTDATPVRPTRLTVGITTYDREPDCIRLLSTLGGELAALEDIDRIVVADQGTRPLSEAPEFADAARTLAEKLVVVRQANLGGSGGFSRAMSVAAASTSTHVLLLDDDVLLEPESVRRLAAFARYATTDAIVGAHMLSLIEPTRLHTFGEVVDRRAMWWTPADARRSDMDLADHPIAESPLMRGVLDVDFNGWWMCLLPVRAVREHGASLPFFIKWDDAEFGLRMSSHGIPTVTLPGAALWHMPWVAKDDGLDWQAYYQFHNRIVTALLHGRRSVLRASLAQDVNHLLCAQYGSVALRNLALRDVLSGPAHLHAVMVAGPPRALAVLRRFGQTIHPAPVEDDRGRRNRPRSPRGAAETMARAMRAVRHQLRPTPGGAPVRLRVARADGKWWAIGVSDVAVVDAASGEGVFVFRRDRAVAVRELVRAVRLRWRIWRRWSVLARDYRRAAAHVSSLESWEQVFAADGCRRDGR